MARRTAQTAEDRDSWLVVIGSSAGGIEALSAVLGSLPDGFSAPIVIAQHLQPTRDSHLPEILGPRSRIPVLSVNDRQPLDPGTAYLVPPDRHVTITDHEVRVEPAGHDHPAPSIDRLLRSAAEVFGDRLIAVILSGMGTDGAAGAAEVKSQGGTVIIQNPETAGHPGMPRALPPRIVDFVADAERIGQLLSELLAGGLTDARPDDERLLRSFLEQVRARTGIDFAAYKGATVRRRLQRRMVATSSRTLRDYVRYVQKDPDEYGRLTSAFLIKVTQFFRDADLFEYLRDTLLPRLIEEARERDRELRIWSGGCATGEEAYSVAILVSDALGAETERFAVRIFATDLDEDAIAFARRGIYPPSSLADLPADVVDRHFKRIGGDFEVTQTIRSMLVFGQHDLGQRAPFPRIDLALCRNVLIYFTRELQKRALQLFAFSLRDGGYLVLGMAESTTPLAEHFVLEHPRLKVYRRAGERVLIPPARIRDTMTRNVTSRSPREPGWSGNLSRGTQIPPDAAADRADQILLALPYGVLVVDEHYDIRFLNAAARRLLGIHGAAVAHDFVHLAHTLPSDALRQALDAALRGEARRLVLPVEDPSAEHERLVITLLFQPRRRPEGGIHSVIVTVIDGTTEARLLQDLSVEVERKDEDITRTRERVSRLEHTTRELLTANEELTSANATLRTANEELLLANEEVQAATEEVETLNEELQATNEELETLNEELQSTVEELNTTNDDLEARSVELQETASSLSEQRQQSELERARLSLVLDGMSEAVLAVDRDGRAVATNRAYDELFGTDRAWVPNDEAGRPFLAADWPQQRAARGERFTTSFTVRDRRGARRWIEATSRGADLGDWGGVIVFRDVTDRSIRDQQERFMAAASHELRTPVAAVHGFLQLAQRRLGDDDVTQAAAYVERSIGEVRRLDELVSRLFDVELAHHGRLALTRKRIDVVAAVARAVDTARVLEGDVSFEFAAPPRPVRILADPMRLQQVVLNILINAATHGRSDGNRVAVTIELVRGGTRIEVRDWGPGIPESISRTAAEPFVTSSADRQGLGLGLYVAKQIVEAHGGQLGIDAADGQGTVVTVSLPTQPRPGGAGVGQP